VSELRRPVNVLVMLVVTAPASNSLKPIGVAGVPLAPAKSSRRNVSAIAATAPSTATTCRRRPLEHTPSRRKIDVTRRLTE